MSSSLTSPTTPTASKLTSVDRSVTIILQNPDQTGSRNDGISSQVERLHRFHGVSLILDSSRELSLGASAFATACAIFHRFFHRASLVKYDVWSVAMASTLLATKIEEEPKTLKQIIDEYAKLYARRLVLADLPADDIEEEKGDDNNDNATKTTRRALHLSMSSPHVACLENWLAKAAASSKWKTAEQRREFCATRLPQQLNKLGPVYKDWHDQISKMESILLRQLGFVLYWIPDSHPHKFILYFCQVLELKDDSFTQHAWNYCNDASWLDLSVRYPADVIASSAILLASRDLDIALPIKPRPWWQVFLGDSNIKSQELVDVANCILAISRFEKDGKTEADWMGSFYGFLRSLIPRTEDNETSFNDPSSFLWEYQKELFDKELGNNA